MEAMVIENDKKFTFVDNQWLAMDSVASSSNKKNNANNAKLEIKEWQEDLEITGKVVTSKNVIPHHSSVIAVNIWVLEGITGVPSFAIGVEEDPSRYGDKLSPAKDTTNIGMTYHPVTYYHDTHVTITPNKNEFKSGKIRVSVQYLKPQGSWPW